LPTGFLVSAQLYDAEVNKNLACVPYAFPPALTDLDRTLQRSHCQLALGVAGAVDAVFEVTCVVVAKALGDAGEHLANFSEEDLATCLKEADALVQQALRALHDVEVARRSTEEFIGHMLNNIVDEAWSQIRIHKEWRKIEARGAAMAFERRRQSKGEKRKAKGKQKVASVASLEESVKAAVQDVHSRTVHYRHISNGAATLVRSGIAQIDGLQTGGEAMIDCATRWAQSRNQTQYISISYIPQLTETQRPLHKEA